MIGANNIRPLQALALLPALLAACRSDGRDVMVRPPEPLVQCAIYSVSDVGTQYLQTILTGDIAFYGLLLAATPNDKRIAEHLRASVVDGLWPFHANYDPTPADSAFVLEGLLAAGVDPSLIATSLRRIASDFFDVDRQAFLTIKRREGFPAFWHVPAVEVNGHLGWLYFRAGLDGEFRGQVDAAARYVAQAQSADGQWKATWLPSKTAPVFYAARFLALYGDLFSAQLEAAGRALLSGQNSDGSWDRRRLETAYGLLALKSLPPNSDRQAAATRAAAWLKSPANAAPLEPVLAYWSGLSERKKFSDCYDLGAVTAAMTQLALR